MKKELIIILLLFGMLSSKEQPTIIFERTIDFETNAQYAFINPGAPANLWQIGVPQKTFFSAASSPPFAIVTDTLHLYPAGNISSFDVGIYGIPDDCWGSAVINFNHKYDTDSTEAGGYLEVSYNDSLNFRNVVFDTLNILPFGAGWFNSTFYTLEDTINGGIPCFHGHSDGWVSSQFGWLWQLGVKSIDPTAMDSLTVRFVFRSNPGAVPKEGWMVDDIFLTLYWCTSSIDDLAAHIPLIMIAPNPVSGETKIRTLNFRHEKKIARLYTPSGKKVLEKRIAVSEDESTIQCNGLVPGIYFLSVSDDSRESAWTKLVVK